jgi:hypothetical protein
MKTTNLVWQSVLDTFRRTKTINPVAFRAIGSFACLTLTYLFYMIDEVYGELAASLPVGLSGLDSAKGTKDIKVSLPGSPPRPAPPGLIHQYEPHPLSRLRAQAALTQETLEVADRLEQLTSIEQLGDGCCQQPVAASALWMGNLQDVRKSIVDNLLVTKDANRVARCEAEGFRVVPTREIINIGIVNGAGSTGSGAMVADGMITKLEAFHRGFSVINHNFVLLPSAGAAVNAHAARANAGKYLLESALAYEHPELIRVHTLDNQTLRFTEAPIVDTVTPVSVGSQFLAAADRSELAARLAVLFLTLITSPLLAVSEEHFADSKGAQGDRRHGLPFLRRIGQARGWIHSDRNISLGKAAVASRFANDI